MLFEKLVENVKARQGYLRADRNQHTVSLREFAAEDLLTIAIPHVVKSIERQATMVDLAVTVGRRVKQQLGHTKDTVGACHIGWFLLIAFFECNVLGYSLRSHQSKGGRKSRHTTYTVYVKDREGLLSLWTAVEGNPLADLYPQDQPFDPWVTGIHSSGVPMIKKVDYPRLRALTPERQPMLFRVLNKLSSTPWKINTALLDVARLLYDSGDKKAPFKHLDTTERQKKESLEMAATATLRLAEKFRDRSLYHLYNCDFR